MTTSQETVEILNDLIEINNDRIVGYEKAIKELKQDEDTDLRGLFLSMIDESRRIAMRDRNAFRNSGRARGVDQVSELLRADFYIQVLNRALLNFIYIDHVRSL